MNVVDSSGWLEYFIDGPNADFFATPIRETDTLIVPTICLYEVFKRVLLLLGEEQALNALGTMSAGIVVDLDRRIAIDAATLSIELKLAMADSLILATAHSHDAALWTQDAHFKDIEGARYIEKR
jgi:predicted nucleic acid-binding protein